MAKEIPRSKEQLQKELDYYDRFIEDYNNSKSITLTIKAKGKEVDYKLTKLQQTLIYTDMLKKRGEIMHELMRF